MRKATHSSKIAEPARRAPPKTSNQRHLGHAPPKDGLTSTLCSYGVSVAIDRVRTVTPRQTNVLAASAPKPVRALPAVGTERIVAEDDGTMLPIFDTSSEPAGTDRRKPPKVHLQEARLTAAPQHGTAATHYAAMLGDVTDSGLRWAQCAHAAAWGLNTQIHVGGDGAPWIADQAQIPFGAQGGYTVDRFHVSDYLTAAGPDPAHAKDDVTRLREALRARPFAQATLRRCSPPCPPAPSPPEISNPQAPFRAALGYLENHPHNSPTPSPAICPGVPV